MTGSLAGALHWYVLIVGVSAAKKMDGRLNFGKTQKREEG